MSELVAEFLETMRERSELQRAALLLQVELLVNEFPEFLLGFLGLAGLGTRFPHQPPDGVLRRFELDAQNKNPGLSVALSQKSAHPWKQVDHLALEVAGIRSRKQLDFLQHVREELLQE